MQDRIEDRQETRERLQTSRATDTDSPWRSCLVVGPAQRILHASSTVAAVLGLPPGTPVLEAQILDLLSLAVGLHQESVPLIKLWIEQCLVQSSKTSARPLFLLTARQTRTVKTTLTSLGGPNWIVAFEDVTAKSEAESELLAIAYQDPLTGAANRLLFERELDKTLDRLAAHTVDDVVVLFLDLDRFKVVNDTLGHAVGDALLRLVGERLQSSLRGADLLARLGGDEFAILLAPSSVPNAASVLAERMIDLVHRPYLIDGQVINVGLSIGIAVAPADGSSRDQLLKSADLALYHSKAAGRGVFNFFQPAMEEKVHRRRALEGDLRKALVLRQFELHYQPQINVDDQTIIGLEGLLRWRHPQRGLVMPDIFLAVTEEIGMAVPIGEWVLKTACREAQRWPESVTIAVNISPQHFEMGKFADTVERALIASKLPGHRLEIEVTEDILSRDAETVRTTLAALRTLGVKVAMDSFGTGLSSLSQLVNFHFDKIKIDRSLIDMHHDGTKHRAVVRAICALGQSLGISTLAEGVETSEQLASVRSEGCDSVQGFYYSKAVPADELVELFSTLFPTGASRSSQTKGDS